MSINRNHERRQLWGFPSGDSTPTPRCTAFPIPSGAVILINKTATITIGAGAKFSPVCTGNVFVTDFANGTTESDFDGPFYASTTPLIYIVAATTVLAWILLIITLVIPARIKNNNLDKSSSFLTGRGLLGSISARKTSSSGGSRPWLQKVAALAVSIALTIATADTFRVAEEQYSYGYLSAREMRDHVSGSTEIRIMRVVSDVFLWLAQVQTLIRLFPRHKEKLVIKWVGFLLIILDVIFSCLNSFLVRTVNRPRSYQDAISALSYLFQLSLSLLYAAWVFYYAITKRRFAFYNRQMPNICIIAVVSMVAIMVPVAFFVADVAQPDVAAWGDYFRWVGAAAGSIVVWEWVERIEALESDERSEGILGREVFEGDEMLGHKPNDRSRPSNEKGGERHGPKWGGSTAVFHGFGGLASRLAKSRPTRRLGGTKRFDGKVNTKSTLYRKPFVDGDPKSLTTSSESGLTPPPNISSPVDRDNTASTASASSTVYAVRYHPTSPSPLHAQEAEPLARQKPPMPRTIINGEPNDFHAKEAPKSPLNTQVAAPPAQPPKSSIRTAPTWVALTHPFKRKRTTPPIEVRNAMSSSDLARLSDGRAESRRLLLSKLDTQGQTRARKSGRIPQHSDNIKPRQPTVIPAPPRGRTWSPDAFQAGMNGIDVVTGTVPSPELHSPQNRGSNLAQSLQFTYTNLPKQKNSEKATMKPTDPLAHDAIVHPLSSEPHVTFGDGIESHPSQSNSSPRTLTSQALSAGGSQDRSNHDDDGRFDGG